MEKQDIIIKNAQVFLETGLAAKDLAIKSGVITAIEDEIESSEGLDLNGAMVLPGVIDSQVHFRDPGLTHKEDLLTGSAAAAYGGVTAFFEMPNTSPPTTSIESLEEKLSLAKAKSYVDYGFFIGADASNISELKKAYELPGCCGIKIFLGSSTGPLLFNDEEKILELFKSVPKDFPISIHSENEDLLRKRKHIHEKATSVLAHPEWRNEETALSSTKKIVDLAYKAGKPIHVLHITTKSEIEFLGKCKDIVTVEVTPQHLTLYSPDCYDRLGEYAQMNPPIRELHHREALWEGINNGTVDIIGSDHAPHLKEEKDKGYPRSPSGMPGVETLLPVMLKHYKDGRLSLDKLVELTCINPSRIFGLQNKGHIRIGRDADLSIVADKGESLILNENMHSKCGWTPFQNLDVSYQVLGTLVRGNWGLSPSGVLKKQGDKARFKRHH